MLSPHQPHRQFENNLENDRMLGNIVFLFAGSRAEKEWPGTLMLLSALLLACFAVSRFRDKNNLTVREEPSV